MKPKISSRQNSWTNTATVVSITSDAEAAAAIPPLAKVQQTPNSKLKLPPLAPLSPELDAHAPQYQAVAATNC